MVQRGLGAAECDDSYVRRNAGGVDSSESLYVAVRNLRARGGQRRRGGAARAGRRAYVLHRSGRESSSRASPSPARSGLPSVELLLWLDAPELEP